jgi:hypothetical protein
MARAGKTIVAVACMAALASCGLATVGTTSASAWTWHECIIIGIGTGTKYSDDHCENVNTSGFWETMEFPANTPIPVVPTATANFTLKSTIAGVSFEITCTKLEGPGAEGTNEEVGGEKIVHGTGGKWKLSGCSVTAPVGKGCTVPSTLETGTLTSTTNSVGSTKFKPASGETFVTISISGCSVAALNGSRALKGTATSSRVTSARQEFTSSSGSSLTFGGQSAVLTGAYHYIGPGGGTVGLEFP